jgi:replicative DNA helicase
MTAVAQALIWMEDNMGIHPDIIFLDYLQQIESERGEDRRMQIFENIHRAKDMALAMGCPVVMGVQANRDVDRRKWRLPELGDGMESSNIEHTADKMISVWKPDTSLDYGDFVTGTNLSVSKNLLIFGIQKQKMGPARNWKPLYIVPEKNEILNVDFSSVIGEDGEIQEELEGLESEDGFGVKERGLM